MDEQQFLQQIDPEVINLAHYKGQQLAGKYGFAKHDAEDIQQDLLLDYLQRSRSFDSHRCSHRTFTRLVVNNCVATIIEARKASFRGYGVRRLALNELFDSEDPNSPELAESLLDPHTRSFEATLNRALDVDRLLARLPVALSRLCRSIMVCDTCAEAATEAGVSRATFYRQIRRVRKELLAGIGREKASPT